MLGIADYGAFCAAILLFLALPGPGTFALLTSTGKGGLRGGAAAALGVIDPERHQGMVAFLAMAVTIALITAAYGLALCAFAQLVIPKVRAHRRVTRLLEQLAGIFLVAFGIRLGAQ